MANSDLEALHAHKDDPDEWDDAPVEVSVRPSPGEVVSFRIPGEELDRLQQAAAEVGVTLSQFIRDAISDKIDGKPWSSLDEVTSGLVKLTLGAEWPRRNAIATATWDRVSPAYLFGFENATSSEGAPHSEPDQGRLPLDA